MGHAMPVVLDQDLDALRLMALARIPRCSACPRFAALAVAHREGSPVRRLPAVPRGCDHEVCSPIVARLAPGQDRGVPGSLRRT